MTADNSSPAVSASPPRVASIDVFRGLTILAMVFVNDVAGIRSAPSWLKHMPGHVDGMTVADLVFPAFLFIVGMAIPFAIARRRARDESLPRIARHVLTRTGSLLIIGVCMVNSRRLDAEAAGISRELWTFLLFVGVILVWNVHPTSEGVRRRLFTGLRWVGVTLLISLAAVYRSEQGDDIIWMRTRWWGILGLIGWAYVTSCAAYLLCRGQTAGMMGVLALLIALYIGDESGALRSLAFVSQYVSIGHHIAAHAAIAVAGVIVGVLFLEHSPCTTPARRIAWIVAFATGLFMAGFLLRPLYGISKNGATPTWCLYSSGICCVVYLVLYWLIDLKHVTRWSRLIAPAGANALLAYILPTIFYSLLAICGVEWLDQHLDSGLAGVGRSAVLAIVMVGLAGILGRLHIRLGL